MTTNPSHFRCRLAGAISLCVSETLKREAARGLSNLPFPSFEAREPPPGVTVAETWERPSVSSCDGLLSGGQGLRAEMGRLHLAGGQGRLGDLAASTLIAPRYDCPGPADLLG